MARQMDMLAALGIAGILLVMLLPLPASFIDFLIMISFSVAVLIIMTSMYVREPIEFSAYPAVLLVATLFRLALNVATTRRILLHGHELAETPGAISQIIEFFGGVVIGGSYVIGFVVFIILTIINFIVITRGAGRIAEVTARFTLDALPGKQMAIDADLSSGLITEEEARRRRERISREADFYGAMDGAAKFVRGDAIAGLVITFVNIIGGLAIGTLQRGLSLGEAAMVYTRLTIGDGLQAQVPAIIISTSAGMIVARSSAESEFTRDIARQLVAYPRALFAGAIILGVIGLLIGMTGRIKAMLSFWAISGAIAYLGYSLMKKEREEARAEMEREVTASLERTEPAEIESILHPDVLGLEVGYALVPLVDETRNGDVVRRVKALRRQFAEELGIILPLVHIRDNLSLKPTEYSILIKGVEVVRGEVYPDRYLVVGYETPKIEGIKARDPVFGVESIWIDEEQRDKAKAMDYTVVDAPTVIITHFSEVIKRHAHEIFTRQDTQRLMDILKKDHPTLVDEVIPNLVPLSVVHRVLQNLLKEGISIKDIVTILETIGDYAGQAKDPDVLTEFVRQSLYRYITKMYTTKGEILGLTFDPRLEDAIIKGVEETDGTIRLKLDPKAVQGIITKIGGLVEKFVPHKAQPIIITSSAVRRYVKKMIEGYYPNVPVIAYQEIDPKVKIRALGVVSLD